MDWEFEVNRCKLLHIKWIINKVLLYSTGNYIQFPMMTNHDGEECEKECACVCIYILNHFAVWKKLIQYYKSTILQ